MSEMSNELLLVIKSVIEKLISGYGMTEGKRGWGIRIRGQIQLANYHN
jgi:hypothetical protein